MHSLNVYKHKLDTIISIKCDKFIRYYQTK